MKRFLVSLSVTAAATAAGGLILFTPVPAGAAVLDQCPTLAYGYHGGCVNELQIELNEYLGTHLAVDGYFGPETYKAVVAFQKQANIRADGIVGPQTKAALDARGAVDTPHPGAPLPPAQPEKIDMCLASTASPCGAEIQHEIGSELPGQVREGYEQGVEGETYPLPGRLVIPGRIVIPVP